MKKGGKNEEGFGDGDYVELGLGRNKYGSGSRINHQVFYSEEIACNSLPFAMHQKITKLVGKAVLWQGHFAFWAS